MKNIIIILLVSLLISSVYGQRKIKKVELNEVGTFVDISYSPTSKSINYSNLDIKITPISANELNSFFIEKNNLNGRFNYLNYEKTIDEYFINRKKEKERKRNEPKNDFEYLINGVLGLEIKSQLSKKESQLFINKIQRSFPQQSGYTPDNIDKNTTSNPYYYSKKYLSVFKIEISNPTSKAIKFNNNFILEIGTSQLLPLSITKIIDILSNSGSINQNKINSLERYHLQQSTIIPSESSITKFFAVLPIDITEKKLDLIFNDSKRIEFKINQKIEQLNKSHTYYVFDIDWSYDVPGYHPKSITIVLDSTKSAIYSNGELFIESTAINNKYQIITVAVDEGRVFIGRQNILAAELLNIDKSKREKIEIEMYSKIKP